MNGKFLSLLIIALVAAAGYVDAAPKSPDEAEPPLFYPPSPNLPRIQYLTKYSSAYDLSDGDKGFRDFVFGGESN